MIRRSRLSRWSLAVILLAAPALHAQTAELVMDIFTRDAGPISSHPQQLRTVGGKLFFVASSTDEEDEVWVTDGTAVGTEMLADFCPLGCAAEPRLLGSTGNLLFFIARDEDISGFRLWRSDGTRAGTFPLTGTGVFLHPEDGESVAAGGVLYFQGCGDESGCELWRSDGTVAGTRILADLEPGSESSDPVELTPVGSQIFFLDDDGDLWRSDGTESGTAEIRDLPPRTAEDQLLFAAGQRLFFFATDDRGPELWGSDGTTAGTLPLTRFAAPDPFLEPFWHRVIGHRVYFRADDGSQGEELWVSDGTAQGTRRVTGFSNPRPFADGLSEFEVEELAGRVIFYATDGVTPRTLWSSAGSPASTALLCRPENCPALTRSFLRPGLVKAGSRLVFAGSDPEHGFEPWATDGTVQGTARLHDLCPGTCDGLPDQPVALLGAAFFTATRGSDRREIWRTDGTVPGTRRWTDPGPFLPTVLEPVALGRNVFFIANDDHGIELWVSDGQPGGTRLVADLGRFAAGGLFLDQEFRALGGRLLFSACSAAGAQLWQSGGTAATTTPLSPAPPSPPFPLCDFASYPQRLTVAGALAYFGLELSRSQLWRTDGTPAGTILLAELPEDASLVGGTLTPLGNRVLFAVDVQGGFELWTSDGTPAGTGKFFALPCCSRARFFAAAGSEVYFSVGLIDTELWRTDGTAAGTRRVSNEGAFWNHARHFIRFGSSVLFFASTDTDTSSPRLQLWKTDGTPAGTVPVSPSVFGSFGEASPLLEHQGALYFLVANSTTASNGLWRTDGTEAGTRLVRELPESFPGASLVPFAGRFFFAAGDAAHGLELWQSDGTTAGTSLVRDVFPGVESSRPSALTVAGGRLFFVARDRFHGIELWQTDGTEAGTRLVQDLAPAGASSEPRTLTVAGDRLFFSADDGVFGRELWALPLGGNAGCQASSSRLCLSGGRFQVEVTWKAANGLTGAGRAVPLTGDTGTFWFFDPANVELVVKVLDGRSLNGHFWVFYGALSDVEYTLTVTDTQTGVSRRYLNLSGRMASVGDTRAFGPLGAFASTPAPDGPALVAERRNPAATAPCQPGPRRLCLNQGRFAVEATWKDFQDHTGDGTAVALTGDTGYFWFFDPANVEVVLKVLDGRGLNGKFWVFYGALSNVEYTLQVTDTQTGIVRTYTNPRGRFASVADTGAF